MTDFTKKSFSVAVGSEKYRDNWDAVFGKKEQGSVECCKGSREGAPKSCESFCAWAKSRDARVEKSWTCDRHGKETCYDCMQVVEEVPESLTKEELQQLCEVLASVEYLLEARPAMAPVLNKLARMNNALKK